MSFLGMDWTGVVIQQASASTEQRSNTVPANDLLALLSQMC